MLVLVKSSPEIYFIKITDQCWTCVILFNIQQWLITFFPPEIPEECKTLLSARPSSLKALVFCKRVGDRINLMGEEGFTRWRFHPGSRIYRGICVHTKSNSPSLYSTAFPPDPGSRTVLSNRNILQATYVILSFCVILKVKKGKVKIILIMHFIYSNILKYKILNIKYYKYKI